MIESSAAMRRPISLLSFACLVLMTAPALRTDAAPTEGRPPSVPEPPAPQRLVAERLCWRTADADYPRVRLHPQRRINDHSQFIPMGETPLIALPFVVSDGLILRILNHRQAVFPAERIADLCQILC